MILCPHCQHDVNPIKDFTPTGIVSRCPRVECAGQLGVAGQDVAQPDKPAPKPKAKAPKANEPLNVLKAAKARKVFVSREAKRIRRELRALEKEEAQLTRLLAAASEPKPIAQVRAIKSAGR